MEYIRTHTRMCTKEYTPACFSFQCHILFFCFLPPNPLNPVSVAHVYMGVESFTGGKPDSENTSKKE